MSEKIYPHSRGIIIDTICDIVELQKAKFTFSDTPHGKIHFMVRMYGYKWEFCFAIVALGEKESQVTLEVSGDEIGKANMLRRELYLLDTMLASEEQLDNVESKFFLKKVLERAKRQETRDKG